VILVGAVFFVCKQRRVGKCGGKQPNNMAGDAEQGGVKSPKTGARTKTGSGTKTGSSSKTAPTTTTAPSTKTASKAHAVATVKNEEKEKEDEEDEAEEEEEEEEEEAEEEEEEIPKDIKRSKRGDSKHVTTK